MEQNQPRTPQDTAAAVEFRIEPEDPNPGSGRRLPFFRKPFALKAFHVSTLSIAYLLALILFRLSIQGGSSRPWFEGNYVGCVLASAALSLIGLFLRPALPVFVLTCLRCYVLLILGYGIGAYLTAKLVLGIGLMVEICVLASFPANLAIAGFAITVLALAQAFPVFFGENLLVDSVSYPFPEELAVFCLVLAFSAVSAAWIARLLGRNSRLAGELRLQELNIDTLAELNRNLQGYARTVDEESAERERNRISREIHDISGYIFTNLIALMDAAGSVEREDHAALTDILLKARRQAQDGLRETRSALRRLRSEVPGFTDNSHAIHKIVSIFRSIAGIQVDLNLGSLPRRLPSDFNLILYRTVQEGLTNAVRHGMASLVRINFSVRDEVVHLTISDNGRGAAEVVKGIGLSGMEERVGALGGSIGVGKSLEGGFALHVDVPLPRPQETPGKEAG